MEPPSAWSPGGVSSQSLNPMRYMVQDPNLVSLAISPTEGSLLSAMHIESTHHFPIEKRKKPESRLMRSFWLVSTTTEDAKADQWLTEFFYTNRNGIHHDVWLLENQLPWKVVESVMNFRPVNLEKFVGKWIDSLHDRKDLKGKSFALDDSYDLRPTTSPWPPPIVQSAQIHCCSRQPRRKPFSD